MATTCAPWPANSSAVLLICGTGLNRKCGSEESANPLSENRSKREVHLNLKRKDRHFEPPYAGCPPYKPSPRFQLLARPIPVVLRQFRSGRRPKTNEPAPAKANLKRDHPTGRRRARAGKETLWSRGRLFRQAAQTGGNAACRCGP